MISVSKHNCFSCVHEFIDIARSGDKDARLCRACWDAESPPANIVTWIKENVINSIGMVHPQKSENCPGWTSKGINA